MIATIIQELKQQMEVELAAFRSFPIDQTFEPNLQMFLHEWERRFAPYVPIRFSYQLSGQHLDITAMTPADALPIIAASLPEFVVDFRKRTTKNSL